jgi:hypothetical protein
VRMTGSTPKMGGKRTIPGAGAAGGNTTYITPSNPPWVHEAS